MISVRTASGLSGMLNTPRHETWCSAGCVTHPLHPYGKPGLQRSGWRNHGDRGTHRRGFGGISWGVIYTVTQISQSAVLCFTLSKKAARLSVRCVHNPCPSATNQSHIKTTPSSVSMKLARCVLTHVKPHITPSPKFMWRVQLGGKRRNGERASGTVVGRE